MTATLTCRSVMGAALLAAVIAVAPGTAGAQDGASTPADPTAEAARPARDAIVTDPDLRRMEERRRRVQVLSGLFERQTRVFRISYRLLYAAVDMCPNRVRPAVGFTYANAYMFRGAVRTAATAMGYSHRISVVEVAQNSAGARAGVQPRDEVLAVGDWPVPIGEGAVTLTQAKLRDILVRDGRTTLTLRRDGGIFTITIEPDYVCDIQVLAVPGDPIRAYTDGDKVVVFEGLHGAVRDDDVLAAAVAREIANTLIPDLDIEAADGVDWSSFFNWGLEPEATGDVLADQSLAQDYGNVSDYVGAYLMARAGFDHRKTPDLWRLMADREAPPPEYSYGAPTPDYVLGLDQAVAEVDRKLMAREPLRPERSGPPAELAAAPEPTGPSAPTPEIVPEPTIVADTTPSDVDNTTDEPTPQTTAPGTGLPWAEPTPAVPSGTEVAGLPWTDTPPPESAAPAAEPPGITVTELTPVPSETPTLIPAPQPTPNVPEIPADTVAALDPPPAETTASPSLATALRSGVEGLPWTGEAPDRIAEPTLPPVARETEIPFSETPEIVIAAVGFGPADPNTSREDDAPAQITVEGLPWIGDTTDQAAAAVVPAAGSGADDPRVTSVAGESARPERTQLIPRSESPGTVVAALGTGPSSPIAEDAEPAFASPADSVVPEPAALTRQVVAPATGDAEIDFLFSDPPTNNASDDADDIGNLIRALEASEADDVTPPAQTAPQIPDTPQVIETPGAPEALAGPGPTLATPDPTPPAETIVAAVEPRANTALLLDSWSFAGSPLPDDWPPELAGLPVLDPTPTAETRASEPQPILADETNSTESALDYIAPGAGPASASAKPEDLGKGFSFRVWLGEG